MCVCVCVLVILCMCSWGGDLMNHIVCGAAVDGVSYNYCVKILLDICRHSIK